METLLWVVIIAAVVVAALYYMRQRGAASARGEGALFERWPLLAPQLLEFASSIPKG